MKRSGGIQLMNEAEAGTEVVSLGSGFCSILQQVRHLELPSPPWGITAPSRLAFFTNYKFLSNYFSKLFADFREEDLFPKQLKRYFISFTISLIRF